MNISLTLGEKLRDLRSEKKLTLSELHKATGIPVPTLQRMESNDDYSGGYRDVEVLARYHNVSADYLFGLTENRLHRNVEVDSLHLTDAAVKVLMSGELNTLLISMMLSHSDFPRVLNAMEIYIDGKLLPKMGSVNLMYKHVEASLKEEFEIGENDKTMALLQEAVLDEDEYLRHRLSERFSQLMKKMLDENKKKGAMLDEDTSLADACKEGIAAYNAEKNNDRRKTIIFAKQIGLNLSKLSNDEIIILTKSLEHSKKYKQARKR